MRYDLKQCIKTTPEETGLIIVQVLVYSVPDVCIFLSAHGHQSLPIFYGSLNPAPARDFGYSLRGLAQGWGFRPPSTRSAATKWNLYSGLETRVQIVYYSISPSLSPVHPPRLLITLSRYLFQLSSCSSNISKPNLTTPLDIPPSHQEHYRQLTLGSIYVIEWLKAHNVAISILGCGGQGR